MKEQKVLQIIKDLAQSQGFYGRLYAGLMHNKNSDCPIERGAYKEYMEQFKDCKEPVDVIMVIECGTI